MEIAAAVPIPVKFKRRKVSAARDYPTGCSPNALPIAGQKRPAEDPLLPVESPPDLPNRLPALPQPPPPAADTDAASSGRADPIVSLKTPKVEPVESHGAAKDTNLEEPEQVLQLAAPETSKGASIAEPAGVWMTVQLTQNRCYPLLYPPPKKREVSGVRDYPAGCGPNAPLLIKGKDVEVVAAGAESSMSKSGDGEKVTLPNQQAEVDVFVGAAPVQKVEIEMEKGVLKQTKPTSAPLRRKDMDAGKNPLVKQQLVPEDSVKVASAMRSQGEVKSNCAEPIGEKVKSKGIGVKKKPLVKQLLAPERSIKVASAEKSQGEVRRKYAVSTREKAQEMSTEAQADPALTSSLGEKTAEEHSESKFMVRYTSRKKLKLEGCEEMRTEALVKSSLKSSMDGKTAGEQREKVPAGSTSQKKLEGHEEKQLCKIIGVKEQQESNPSLDAKSQSGSKEVVKEGSNSVGKVVEKGLVKHQSKATILKTKFSEEEESKRQIATNQTEGNSGLVVYGDRVIVQALMAAPNCPWGQGRKSGGFSSRSITPKNNVKKGRKLLTNTAVKGASISPLKIEMVAEDEEDSILEGEDSEMALVLYNRSPEHSITLPPLVPPKWDHRGSNEELSDRNKVKRTLRLFQFLTRKLLQEVESKKDLGQMRVDLKAVAILKEKNECMDSGKPILGHMPGVEVGDEFHYRVELSIVGLHRPYQGGIDYSKIDGMLVATSIVASGGYADVANSSDVLIYSGSGGNPVGGDTQAGDQKLERGNLALKNSIEAGTPVRVIHGFKELKGSELDPKVKGVSAFIYDGLYVVEKYWTEKGCCGNSVFMFQLRRMGGQPELALKEVKRSNKSKVRESLCIKDISKGKESIPICAINTKDDDRPVPFNYTTNNKYPSWCVHTLPIGCDCTDGCSDFKKCVCAAKNGGEIPFNYSGAIVEAKPLVYECGPSCKCPPSCQNRVSQHGIRVPLEIFKTESRGWGVRSLYSITSGSFICEYIGELLKDSEAELRSNDEYLFDIGHNYEDKTLWEGLPSFIPGLHASSPRDTMDDVGFTIDAAAYGNIGRFINHSCSPNIYAQNVLYDHDDKRMPHIMFFAADNIPPLQELTYHYNYTVDQVRDSEGNIKQKSCYCGAPDCTGRLY